MTSLLIVPNKWHKIAVCVAISKACMIFQIYNLKGQFSQLHKPRFERTLYIFAQGMSPKNTMYKSV